MQKYGLGIEMEFGGINDKYISQFRSYLTQGADDKLAYQNNSLIAWYTHMGHCRDEPERLGHAVYLRRDA